MSHHKHHKRRKQYEYRIISSKDIKGKDGPAVDTYLNTLGAEGWDLVTIELKEKGTTGGISFLGLMKRKTYRQTGDHSRT